MQYEIIWSGRHQLRIFRESKDEALPINVAPVQAAADQGIDEVPVPAHHVKWQIVGEVHLEQLATEHRLPQIDPAGLGNWIVEDEATVVQARAVDEAEHR